MDDLCICWTVECERHLLGKSHLAICQLLRPSTYYDGTSLHFGTGDNFRRTLPSLYMLTSLPSASFRSSPRWYEFQSDQRVSNTQFQSRNFQKRAVRNLFSRLRARWSSSAPFMRCETLLPWGMHKAMDPTQVRVPNVPHRDQARHLGRIQQKPWRTTAPGTATSAAVTLNEIVNNKEWFLFLLIFIHLLV